MANQVVTSLDIGTSRIRVVMAVAHDDGTLQPLTIIEKQTHGISLGQIVNEQEFVFSLREALSEAQRQSRMKIRSLVIAGSGTALDTVAGSGTIAISRADSEVTSLDVDRVTNEIEQKMLEGQDRKVLHTIPLEFKIDGKKIIGTPEGIKGGKLEAKVLFITIASPHLKRLIKAVESTGVEVEDVFASPIAESVVTVSNLQKKAGALIVNIGAETVSMVIFEDGYPRALDVFKIGGNDITNDIALGLRIPLEEADELKRGYGTGALPKSSQKEIRTIIDARLTDIFEIIDDQLKKLGRSGLLPAGVVITGGSAYIPNIESIAKEVLRLPATVAKSTDARLRKPPQGDSNNRDEQKFIFYQRQLQESIRGPEWTVAYGLAVLASGLDTDHSVIAQFFKQTKHKISRFIQQFLP